MKSFTQARIFIFAAALCGGMAHAVALAANPSCDDALAQFDYAQAAKQADTALLQRSNDAAMRICLARAHYERGDFNTALQELERAAAQQPEGATAVRMGNWFGVTLRRLGRSDEAWRAQQLALRLAREINDQAGLATALHNTAGMRHDRGDTFGALRDYQASIPINPDLAERSASYNNMGLIYLELGNARLARQSIETAIVLNRTHGHFHHLGKHLMNLGVVERAQGNLQAAAKLIEEGQPLIEKAGDVFWLGVAEQYRAWLANEHKQVDKALLHYQLARRYFEQSGAAGEVKRLEEEMRRLSAR